MNRRGERGVSLLEVLLVASLIGIVARAALPDFRVALETRRVDEAESVLAGLWSAERMHWLEHGVFTRDVQALVDARLLAHDVLDRDGPFRYEVRQADERGFHAEAVRANSDAWKGALTIDEAGVIGGEIVGRGGVRVTPAPQ